jgi:hypothetical protein
MKAVRDFISKLEKLTYVNTDRGETFLTTEEGFKVSYSLVVSDSLNTLRDLPIQVVVRVDRGGEHIATWGCEDNSSNSEFLSWFKIKANKIKMAEQNKSLRLKREGIAIFNNI